MAEWQTRRSQKPMSSWRVSSNLTSGTTSLEESFPIPDTTLQTKRAGVGIRRRVRLWPQPDSLFHPGPRLCNAPGYPRTLGEHLLATTWKSSWTCRAPPYIEVRPVGCNCQTGTPSRTRTPIAGFGDRSLAIGPTACMMLDSEGAATLNRGTVPFPISISLSFHQAK